MTEQTLQYRPLELAKPYARKRDSSSMLPIPAESGGLELLEKQTCNLVTLECHRNDRARFEHAEWLLSGDGDVSWHAYYLVGDIIYSIARVEI